LPYYGQQFSVPFFVVSSSDHLTGAAGITWTRSDAYLTKDGGAFVPHPATWLRARRWEDEPFNAPLDTVTVPATRGARAVQAMDLAYEAIQARKKLG